MESLLDDLQTERTKYGATMTKDECVALINAVLWKNRGKGFKQAEKPGGNSGRRRDGKHCSVDGIVFMNPGQPDDRTFIDTLKDAGGKSVPAWQVRKIGSIASDGHVIGPWTGSVLDPIDPDGVPDNPPPPPPPPPPNKDDYDKRLDALEAMTKLAEARSRAVETRVQALENKPTPPGGQVPTMAEIIDAVVRDVRTEDRGLALTHSHGLIKKA